MISLTAVFNCMLSMAEGMSNSCEFSKPLSTKIALQIHSYYLKHTKQHLTACMLFECPVRKIGINLILMTVCECCTSMWFSQTFMVAIGR